MPSLFLSHSSADKAFARRLADDLGHLEVTVWIDEAELRVGDSLIERIANAIQDTEFVGAIISENSVRSAWVQKELYLAMTKEIESRRVVVLPILIGCCEIPVFLIDKLYADFRDIHDYGMSLAKLHRAISRSETTFERSIRTKIGDKMGWRARLRRLWQPLKWLLMKSAFQLVAVAFAFLAGVVFVAVWLFNYFAEREFSFNVGDEFNTNYSAPFIDPKASTDEINAAGEHEMKSLNEGVQNGTFADTDDNPELTPVEEIHDVGEASEEMPPVTPTAEPLPAGGVFEIPGPSGPAGTGIVS